MVVSIIRHRARQVSLLLTLAVIGAGMSVGVVWVLWPAPIEYQRGPLAQQAFVWQRVWDKPVQQAVDQHSGTFRRLVVLVGEVSFDDDQITSTRIEPGYAKLREADASVGLALRINDHPGPFRRDDPTATRLGELA